MATSAPVKPSPAAFGTLLASGTALAALAVYQWYELLEVRGGGTASCAINATINCAKVWDSAMAVAIHDSLGMPVAALGIVYGVVAAGLAGLALWATGKGADASAYLAAVKLCAAAGLAGVAAFAAGSWAAGAVCLTCLGTYALTAVYAYGAFKLLPGPLVPATQALVPGAAWGLVLAVPVYLSLLGPGGRTPHANASTLKALAPAGAAAQAQDQAQAPDIEAYFASLPERQKQEAALARRMWLDAPALDNSAYPVRQRLGGSLAPVRVVDFTDILCGHCKTFENNITEVLKSVPPGSLSVEPRHYPLDGECNPDVGKVWGDGIRCLAARAQICLEGKPAYQEVRHALFANQQGLTQDFIVRTVQEKAGLSPEALQACVRSGDTNARLLQDIEYARRYRIEGTPMVLVNDKEAPPVPVFLLGLALAKGDPNASFFLKLPPPPTSVQ